MKGTPAPYVQDKNHYSKLVH